MISSYVENDSGFLAKGMLLTNVCLCIWYSMWDEAFMGNDKFNCEKCLWNCIRWQKKKLEKK